MTRQSLREHAAFAALDNIDDKMSVEEITDLLISVGYIESSPDDYRRYQIEQARDTIRAHRKSKQRAKDIQHELANLTEQNDQGVTVHYYKPCGLLDTREAAQHVTTLRRRHLLHARIYRRHADFQFRRHGDELQRLLDFMLPIRRRQASPA